MDTSTSKKARELMAMFNRISEKIDAECSQSFNTIGEVRHEFAEIRKTIHVLTMSNTLLVEKVGQLQDRLDAITKKEESR